MVLKASYNKIFDRTEYQHYTVKQWKSSSFKHQ